MTDDMRSLKAKDFPKMPESGARFLDAEDSAPQAAGVDPVPVLRPETLPGRRPLFRN